MEKAFRALGARCQEARELGEELARLFFGDEVAAVERLAAHVLGHLAPVGEAIEQRLDHTVPAPER